MSLRARQPRKESVRDRVDGCGKFLLANPCESMRSTARGSQPRHTAASPPVRRAQSR
jgi:hypothetical protein